MTTRRLPRPTLLLPRSVIGACSLQITPAPTTRELQVPQRAASRAAHPLRRPRRYGGLEALAALGASTTHPPSVHRAWRQARRATRTSDAPSAEPFASHGSTAPVTRRRHRRHPPAPPAVRSTARPSEVDRFWRARPGQFSKALKVPADERRSSGGGVAASACRSASRTRRADALRRDRCGRPGGASSERSEECAGRRAPQRSSSKIVVWVRAPAVDRPAGPPMVGEDVRDLEDPP